jgi:hypothetical protein
LYFGNREGGHPRSMALFATSTGSAIAIVIVSVVLALPPSGG